MRPAIPGQSAANIASLAGIDIPEDTPVLIAEIKGVGHQYPLSHEKLSPVLAMIKTGAVKMGWHYARRCLIWVVLGPYPASLHHDERCVTIKFARRMKACRVLVNTPSAQVGLVIYTTK